MSTRLALAIGFALAAAPAFASTLEVGPPGSGYPYASIQAAIDAAAPGDVVLVHAGTYSEFSLSKHVRVVGDGPGSVVVQNSTSANPYLCMGVTGIPVGGEALVSGITFRGTGISSASGNAPPVTLIEQCAGTVLLHDVVIVREPTTYDQAKPNLEIRDCAWVHLFQSSVKDVAAFVDSLRGDGVVCSNSTLWIARSVVGSSYTALNGGGFDGLQLFDSVAYVAESAICGETGGTMFGPVCATFGTASWFTYGATGGDALDVRGASVVKLVGGPGSNLQGGEGGFGFCAWGSRGPALRIADTSQVLVSSTVPVQGAVVVGPAAAQYPVSTVYPTMHLAPPAVQVGGQATLHLAGNAGNPMAVFASGATSGPFLVPGIDGAVGLDPASVTLFGAASLDPLGAASLAIAVPLSPALVGAMAVLQSLEIGPPQLALSNPLLLVVNG